MVARRILIIEDDEGIRDSLKNFLEFEDYEVFSATNGKEGLEALNTRPLPCLILLDFMMPVMNGQEFIEALAKNERIANIPIVVISAYGERAKAMKSVGFIKKPIELDVLMGLIKQYCG